MFPPTVTGFAELPTGAAGSCGTPAGAGVIPVLGGTAPVGCEALGSPVAGVAGVAGLTLGSAGVAGMAGSVGVDSWGGAAVLPCCALATPATPVVNASIAAPASMIDLIGLSFPILTRSGW